MLESISIKNIALIDESVIEFGCGLNILSGETGAGKSIIIDSLNFALGEKTGKGIIRAGQTMARVEAVFCISEPDAINAIKDNGVEIDDDGLVIITRTINDSGKTVTKVNGHTVTASMLKKISEELIDIHGQHEHQSLLNAAKHISLVDDFCGDELLELKKSLQAEFKKYKETKKQIDLLTKKDDEDRLSYLEYKIEELLDAKLKAGEEERLAKDKEILRAADKLLQAIGAAVRLLYDDDGAAIESVNEAAAYLEKVTEYDDLLLELLERLTSVSAEIDDISRDLRRYIDSIDADPKLLDEIETRLSKLYIIKRKYGGTVESAMEALSQMQEEYEELINLAPELTLLNKTLSQCEKSVVSYCNEITALRKKSAELMEKQITEALNDLGMEDAELKINIEKGPITQNGRDKVELFILTNKGESFKPLSKIASGGEMSRIMLAIKSIVASSGFIETFIFDEIDTGVSGRTAQKVAEKMAVIAAARQIICITHLPQIAAMADRNILITKTTEGEKTITDTTVLDENEVAKELGRLLGGAKITEQTIKAASEMRALAQQIKNRGK